MVTLLPLLLVAGGCEDANDDHPTGGGDPIRRLTDQQIEKILTTEPIFAGRIRPGPDNYVSFWDACRFALALT